MKAQTKCCQNKWQRSNKNVCDHSHSPNFAKEFEKTKTKNPLLGLSKLEAFYKELQEFRELAKLRQGQPGLHI